MILFSFKKIRYAYIYVETNLLLSNDLNAKKIEGNSFLISQKSEENDNNHFSNCSLKILNLHRNSKNQQTKNIARSANDLGIALCSCFVDILIFYANLKFSVGHGTLTKLLFYCISHVFFSCKIKDLRLKLAYAS